MTNQNTPIKTGQFYSIFDEGQSFVLEDRTKKGLEVLEKSYDDKFNTEADKGMIYDIDGIGHRVAIRWYFTKAKYLIGDVITLAEGLDTKYREIREMTCPDD
ncbi:MAG: hypothetical protein ACTHKP_02165 [Nitrososphaeraceae archaeon]